MFCDYNDVEHSYTVMSWKLMFGNGTKYWKRGMSWRDSRNFMSLYKKDCITKRAEKGILYYSIFVINF